MNYLMHRMHATALATLMLGLLCIHFPARAAQADYAALKKRVAAVESALAELEKISSKYLAGEAELALHLAAVKREETKIHRNYAEYKALIRSWAYIGKLDPEGTKSKLNQTQKQTKKLRSALAAWNQQVQQARQTQYEICANKARIDSGSPQQIAQWKESGSRMLVTHTTQLREKRKVLTAAWSGLNSVSSELGIQLGRLKGFLLKKEEYMTSFSRMKALADTSKVTCRGLEKDLAKAKELQNELKKLMKEALTYRRTLLPELEWLQKQVAIETDFLSNTDRADLKARIDSALVRLESTTLSRPLPAVTELNSRCETFIDASDQLDSAKMKTNLQHAESIAADARAALTPARAALKEASSAQAGFGGLGKARHCLAALRRARTDAKKTDVDEVLSLVEGLQTRLEEAERQEHIFTTRNRENQSRTKEMKSLAEVARLIFRTWQQGGKELFEPLGPLNPDQTIQDFEKLLSGLTLQMKKLEEAAGELTKAIQDTEQKSRSACDRVVKASSVPLPSGDELKTWHQEANSDIDRMRKTLEAASGKVQVHVGLVATQAQKVTTSRDEMSAAKDKLSPRLMKASYLIVQMDQAQENVTKATEIWKQVTREGKALERLRKANLEELKRIQTAAAELAPRLINESTIAELKTIEARTSALVRRYPQSEVVVEPDRPKLYNEVAVVDWKKLKPIRDTIERQIRKIKALIKNAGTTLEQAKSVQEASARERSLFPDILAKADKCVSELATKLSDGRKLEAELKTMVDNANALYQECRFNKVMPILKEALAKARSEKHKKSIKDKIKLTERRHKYEKTTIALFNDADTLYKKGKYSDALDKLQQAREHTSCQRFKDSLDKKIAKVQGKLEAELRAMVDDANALYRECRFNKVMPILKEALVKARSEKHKKSIKDKIKLTERRHKYEKTTIALFNDADTLYNRGNYSRALDKLQQAKEHTSCRRFKDSLDNKIAKVQGKINSQGSMEQQGRQDAEQKRRQTQQPASCATLAQQLRNQVEEIRKQVQHYSNLKDARPPLPRSRTGPAACKVVEAEKRYRNIWMQAKNANCTEATRIKHPYGISTIPIGLECWRYSGSP